MANLTLPITVSRTELSLSPLSISAANGYYVKKDGIGKGDVKYRRITADSPFVRGRVPVHIVPDVITLNPTIRVNASTIADFDNKLTTLTNAFTQFQYTVVYNLSGSLNSSFLCETADYTIGNGGNYDSNMLRSFVQEVTFQIPSVT